MVPFLIRVISSILSLDGLFQYLSYGCYFPVLFLERKLDSIVSREDVL